MEILRWNEKIYFHDIKENISFNHLLKLSHFFSIQGINIDIIHLIKKETQEINSQTSLSLRDGIIDNQKVNYNLDPNVNEWNSFHISYHYISFKNSCPHLLSCLSCLIATVYGRWANNLFYVGGHIVFIGKNSFFYKAIWCPWNSQKIVCQQNSQNIKGGTKT
jgi:hypothetical protein